MLSPVLSELFLGKDTFALIATIAIVLPRAFLFPNGLRARKAPVVAYCNNGPKSVSDSVL